MLWILVEVFYVIATCILLEAKPVYLPLHLRVQIALLLVYKTIGQMNQANKDPAGQ